MDGTVREIDEDYELRFERHLPHPIEKVWAALTDPDEWKDWLAEDGTIELRVGGRVHMSEHGIESTVTELDPPNVIAYEWKSFDWDGGIVRWQLDAADDGTTLVLTHRLAGMTQEQADEFHARFPDLPDDWEPLPSTLAGWHSILERLEHALDGAPIPSSIDDWKALNERYKSELARR